jgi:hypothetical protein
VRLRDALTVVGGGHLEPGVLLYGLVLGAEPAPPGLALDGWPEGAVLRRGRLRGEGWTIWVLELGLPSLPAPEAWAAAVAASLDALITAGARVAWAGFEGLLVEPPGLFDPEAMEGAVWAARTADGLAFGPPPLDAPLQVLDAAALGRLAQAARPRSS